MKKVKKIWNAVTTVLVILVVILALALVGIRLLGVQVYAVLSGSMEPEYPTGSLIYVRPVEPAELEVGDVITFMVNEDTVATHRIYEILVSEEDPTVIRFRTKGDVNNAPDGSLVHYKNVLGSPIFAIPYLGYVASFIQHPPGTYFAIAIGAIVLLQVFLPDLIFPDDKKEEKEAEETPAEDQPQE